MDGYVRRLIEVDLPIKAISEHSARQWMQFYTKVLSRFARQEGLQLEVNFKASPPEGVSKDKVDETKRYRYPRRETGQGFPGKQRLPYY